MQFVEWIVCRQSIEIVKRQRQLHGSAKATKYFGQRQIDSTQRRTDRQPTTTDTEIVKLNAMQTMHTK